MWQKRKTLVDFPCCTLFLLKAFLRLENEIPKTIKKCVHVMQKKNLFTTQFLQQKFNRLFRIALKFMKLINNSVCHCLKCI